MSKQQKKKKEKRYGLRLTLGGAPDTPHAVPGLPGYYRPGVPTPVGEGCALSVAEARKAEQEIDCVELVEVDNPEDAAEVAERDVQEGTRGVVDALRDGPSGSETARVEDEREAIKAAQNKESK